MWCKRRRCDSSNCLAIRRQRLRRYFLTLGRRRTPKLVGAGRGSRAVSCYKIDNRCFDGEAAL
jgi:hypothetical protein